MSGTQIQLVRRMSLNVPQLAGGITFRMPLALDVDALGWGDAILAVRLYSNTYGINQGSASFKLFNTMRAEDEPSALLQEATPIATISVDYNTGQDNKLLQVQIPDSAAGMIGGSVSLYLDFLGGGGGTPAIEFSVDIIARDQ